MKLTTKHKVYLGIVVLGAAFLIYDRATAPSSSELSDGRELLVTPATVSATPATPVRAAAATPATKPASAIASQAALIERLDSVANTRKFDYSQTRDAFVPSPNWIPAHVAITNAQPPRASESSPSQFLSRHRLMSTVSNSKSPSAMVDGRLLRVGDELDGYKLVSVSKQAATFESGASRQRAELKFRADGATVSLPTENP